MPQGSLQWQGTQRRAYAPGAHWNVQVVKGKVTTRCLWHACKALGIGLLLMLLGACMATIGYYADQLSVAQEIRGNLTVRVKNESRGFHLNNLSYAGPIVMGFGVLDSRIPGTAGIVVTYFLFPYNTCLGYTLGFIVVAACVMTFEARDSAAKVVPARYRFNQASTLKNASGGGNSNSKSQRNRKSTSSQTSKWDHQLGLFRVNRSPSPSLRDSTQRRQLTQEFMQFSKNLNDKGVTNSIKKSPSAPSLVVAKRSPRQRGAPKFAGGCALLNPELLKRHAISVDNPGYNPQQITLEHQKLSGSQASMAMDLHLPNKGPVTLKVKDRSDTARRHQLARQTKIEDAEDLEDAKRTAALNRSFSPKLPGSNIRYPDDFVPRKRNSIDIRILEDLAARDLSRSSPRDFHKISSPNFRKMSLDRLGGERRVDKSLGFRKASLEFRRSPDFRRADYREYSIERFTADCAKYLAGELEGGRASSRASSGENLQRKPRQHPKLYHSRSDDNRRRSFDRHRGDSQSSRYSLNTQAVVEDRSAGDYELKYFTTTTAATSLDTEESRCDVSDSDISHAYDEGLVSAIALSDGAVEADALLEEPELENEIDCMERMRDSAHYAKQETLSTNAEDTLVDIEREDTSEGVDDIKSDKEADKSDTVVDIGED